MQDHPYNGSFMDTWTLLAALGARTERVHLMVNVANLPLRHPAMLAKAAATLDLITQGRVKLGVGAGAFWDGIESFGGVRRTPKEAVEAFEEGMRIIRLFLSPETQTVSFAGKHYVLKGAQAGPKPKHPIRLWVGGYGERMLRIAGELADGITVSLPYLPPERLPVKVEAFKRSAQRHGRDPAKVFVNYNLGGLIVGSKEERPILSATEGVIVGTVDEWVETLVKLGGLGANSFNFWPAGPDKLGQTRLFAERVVPEAREALKSLRPTP